MKQSFINLDELILYIDDNLKQLNIRYVYCGSISLYLNGIKNIKEFHDIDIDFIDILDENKKYIQTPRINNLNIDKLKHINNIKTRYHKIIFYNREFLISNLDFELEIKYELLKIKNYRKKDKLLDRINQINSYKNLIE